MDNFDLHKYLKNNPLLAESTDNKLTRGKLKEMVREMLSDESDSPMNEEEEINEMARIAKPSKLADNWEEQMANLPDRFKKSTRFDRVIKYFQKYNDKIGQPIDPNTDPLTAKAIDYYGTLAHIADEEFQSSDTASAAPIVAALKDAGIVVTGDFVTEPAKYSKEPSVPGAKGRPKTETGYFQNAMSKFKEGNYDFSAEEKNALENMVKALQAALTKKPESAAKKK
jgi:hypothetical protein